MAPERDYSQGSGTVAGINNTEGEKTDSGLTGLRQHKLLRITKEAIEQGALLSYEDIAFMLTNYRVEKKVE